jgi:4'-phosphopantetheinyl transferase
MQLDWPTATDPPKLSPGEAHVWAVPLLPGEATSQDLLATLASEERARADEFRFERPRRQFIITRSALRVLLGHYLAEPPKDIRFTFEGMGKPRLPAKYAAADLRFNVSHSGDLALIALTRGCDVGIDVEQLRSVAHLEQIARRFFHPAEVDAVLAAAPDVRSRAFLRCWTAKEAVLKAYGSGIAGSLDAFQVPLAESYEGPINLSAMPKVQEGLQCWLQRLVPCDGYIAALAFASARGRTICHALAI